MQTPLSRSSTGNDAETSQFSSPHTAQELSKFLSQNNFIMERSGCLLIIEEIEFVDSRNNCCTDLSRTCCHHGVTSVLGPELQLFPSPQVTTQILVKYFLVTPHQWWCHFNDVQIRLRRITPEEVAKTKRSENQMFSTLSRAGDIVDAIDPSSFESRGRQFDRVMDSAEEALKKANDFLSPESENSFVSNIFDKIKSFFSAHGVSIGVGVGLVGVTALLGAEMVRQLTTSPDEHKWLELVKDVAMWCTVAGAFMAGIGVLGKYLRKFVSLQCGELTRDIGDRFDDDTPAAKRKEAMQIAPRVTENQVGRGEGVLLSSLIAALLSFVRYVADPDRFDVTKELSNLRRVSTGISTLGQAVEALTHTLPEEYRKVVYEKFGVGLTQEIPPAKEMLLKRAFSIVEEGETHPERIDMFYKSRHAAIQKELDAAMIDVASIDSNPSYQLYAGTLRSVSDRLRRLEPNLRAVSGLGSQKLQPTAIWFYGAPGLGKSLILSRMMRMLFPSAPEAILAHNVCLTDSFDSGYNGQLGFIIDEPEASIKRMEDSKIMSKILDYISPKSNFMNMAFEKGKKFSSHILAIGSNSSPLAVSKASGLSTPAALLRRFRDEHGLSLLVYPKEQYHNIVADQKGNTWTVTRNEAFDALSDEQKERFEHLDFYMGQDLKPYARPSSGALSFTQVMNRIASMYLANLQRFEGEVKRINSTTRIVDQKLIDEIYEATKRVETRMRTDNQMLRKHSAARAPPLETDHVSGGESSDDAPNSPLLIEKQAESEESEQESPVEWSAFPATVRVRSTSKSSIRRRRTSLARDGKYQKIYASCREICLYVNKDYPGGLQADCLRNLQEGKYVKKANEPGHIIPTRFDRPASKFNYSELHNHFGNGLRVATALSFLARLCLSSGFSCTDTSKVMAHVRLRENNPLPLTVAFSDVLTYSRELDPEERFWLADPILEPLVRSIVLSQDLPIDSLATVRQLGNDAKEQASSFWDSLKENFSKATERKLGLGALALIATGVSAIIGVTMFLVKRRVENSSSPVDDGLVSQSGWRTRTAVRARLPRKGHGPGQNWSDQYRSTVNQDRVSDRKIVPPTFSWINRLKACSAEVKYDQFGQSVVARVWRDGTGFLCNYHTFCKAGAQIEPNVTIEYRGQTFLYQFRWADAKVLALECGTPIDMIYWHPPRVSNFCMPAGPSLAGLFVDQAHLPRAFGGPNLFMGRQAFLISNTEKRELKTPVRLSTMEATPGRDESFTPVDGSCVYAHNDETKRGDCNMLLSDGQMIFGVHMAAQFEGGEFVEAFAQVITRQMILEARKYFTTTQNQIWLQDGLMDQEMAGYLPEVERTTNNCCPEGFILRGYTKERASTQQETRLVRTALRGPTASSCVKVPAAFSTRDPRFSEKTEDADEKAYMALLQRKFSRRPEDFDSKQVQMALDSLAMRVPPASTVRVFDLDEALNPGKEMALNRLPRNTGAGFSWKLPGRRGKTHIIEYNEEEQIYVAHPLLAEQVELKSQCCERGQIPYTIFSSFPKDELLSEEKIKTTGAREITASQTCFSLLVRKYFGAFSDAFNSANLTWGHAIGLNVMGKDWDRMIKAMYLDGVPIASSKGVDLDVKKFDSTVGAQFFFAWVRAINAWYRTFDRSWEKSHDIARVTIIHCIVFSNTLVGRTVSQSLMGNPSGQPLTTIVNTFAIRLYLSLCYINLVCDEVGSVEDIPCLGMSGFLNYVKVFGLGDDSLMNIHPSILSQYNYNTIQAFLARHRVLVTGSDKKGQGPPCKPLIGEDGCEFLSCKTHVKRNMLRGVVYVPIIKDSSVSKCLAYCRPSPDLTEEEAVRSNIVDTMRRIWFHGPERYEKLSAELRSDCFDGYGFVPLIPTFEEVRASLERDKTPVSRTTANQSSILPTQGGPVVVNAESGSEDLIVLKTITTEHQRRDAICDQPQTLRAVARRFFLSYAFTPADAVSGSLVVRHGTWSKITSPLPTGNLPVSALDVLTAPFGLWTGTMVYRIVCKEDLFVTYRPVVNTSAGQGWSRYDASAPPGRGPGCPMAYLNGDIGYVDILVPFTNRNNACEMWFNTGSAVPEEHSAVGDIIINYQSASPSQKVLVFQSGGDGFNFGVCRFLPLVTLRAANIEPDTYPLATIDRKKEKEGKSKELPPLPAGFEGWRLVPSSRKTENQGITVSTQKIQNHLEGIADSTFQSNPHNSAETKTKVDAKAGNDKPNWGQEIGGLVRVSQPSYGPCEGVTYAQVMGASQKLEETLVTPFRGIDDLAYDRCCRLTFRDVFEVTPLTSTGTVIASIPLCPNGAMVGMILGSSRAVSSMCYFSANVATFWTGSLRYSFQFLAPGMATCRIAIAVLYTVHSTPATPEEILSQVYAVYDVNSGSRTMVVDVPYVASTEMLEVYNGQTDESQYSAGTLYILLMNAFRAPDAAAQLMRINVFEGAGTGFSLKTPFGVNPTVVPQYAGYAVPTAIRRRTENQMLAKESESGNPSTEQVGATMAESNPGEAKMKDVAATMDTAFVQQPMLTFADYLARPQLIGTFGWTTLQAEGTDLYDRDVPLGMLSNTAKRAFESFHLYGGGNVSFTLKVNGNSFFAGRLVMYFVPLVINQTVTTNVVSNRSAITWVSHAFVDAQASASVTLTVPYRFYRPYRNGASIGRIKVTVFNQLAVGSGSTDIEVSMFVHFNDTQLRAIKYTA